MNAPLSNDLMSAWLLALRSGKYRQARGTLHDIANASYCCLGVLREEARLRGMELPEATLSFHLATVETQNAVGITCQQQRNLARLNDGGCSFEEIAQLVESEMVSPGYAFAMFRAASLTALKETP